MTTTLENHPALRLTQLTPAARTPDRALHPVPDRTRRDPLPSDRRRSGDRRDRLGLALSELFASRRDLTGVSPVADVLAEDLLWSV